MVNKTNPWKNARLRMIPLAVGTIASVILEKAFYDINNRHLDYRIVAYAALAGFVLFGLAFLHTFTDALNKSMISRRLGIGRAAAIRFGLRVAGYLIILLGGLEMLDISVAKLLLGGAVIGIIFGVAAQQSLANFFASIILILAHPFRVGEEVVMVSGALGGTYKGTVLDIGLTHTRLRQEDGGIVFMPNATILSGAAIMPSHGTKRR